MKNKTLVIIIGIVATLLIVLFGIKYNFSGSIGKLKSDISYPTSNGLAFSCESTSVSVDNQTKCSLVGKNTGGIRAVSGEIHVSDGLEIVSITYDDNVWNSQDNVNNGIISFLASPETSEQFIIAEVTVKGLETSNSNITFTSLTGNDKIQLSNSDFEDIELSDVVQSITVTDDSSSGGENPVDELSSINTLESLTVSAGTLSPSFDRATNEYNIVVPYNVSQITINGTLTDSKASVDGFNEPYNLNVGSNSITITVTAEDGMDNEYTIVIIRENKIDGDKSSDNTLNGLTIEGVTLSPAFSPLVTEYSANVGPTVNELQINASLNNPNASLEISGSDSLQEGTNTIDVTVTAENNSVKTYTIIVTKQSASGDSCILELTSSAYKVDNSKQLIDLVNQEDSNQTILNNLTYKCGTLTISDGKVILTDGKNVKTYTINRVFVPKTGQNVIKYTAIILGIVLIIGVLIFIKKKMDK